MDDFFDDFDEGVFMDGDDFEDRFDENCEPEDCIDDGAIEPESHGDDFEAKDAFLLGVAMGFAYEEGLEEAERRKLEK